MLKAKRIEFFILLVSFICSPILVSCGGSNAEYSDNPIDDPALLRCHSEGFLDLRWQEMTEFVCSSYGLPEADFSQLNLLPNLKSLKLNGVGRLDANLLTVLTGLVELEISYSFPGRGPSLYYTHLENLSALSTLDNLSKLTIRGIPSLYFNSEDLKYLQQITELDLTDSGVEDFTFLSELTQLEKLFLNQTYENIESDGFSFLSKLTSLKELSLSFYNKDFSDIYFLSELDDLTYLRIDGATKMDYSPLQGLTKLEKLALVNSEVDDFLFLLNVPQLNEFKVVLSEVNRADYSFLAYLPNIKKLDLSNNGIVVLPDFTTLNNLVELNLERNSISNISSLSGLVSLEKLNLDYNSVISVSPIVNLSNLVYLTAEQNRLIDIFPLSGLGKLNYLNLRGNYISDISVMSNLVEVSYLDLSANRISNISSLSKLSNLEELALYNNAISDVSALSYLRDIATLDLMNNQLVDVSPLSYLSHRFFLNIAENCNIRNLQFLPPNITFLNPIGYWRDGREHLTLEEYLIRVQDECDD